MSSRTPAGDCRKCGKPISRRTVGKDQSGRPVRRWCTITEGSPGGLGPGGHAPVDCAEGGYHEIGTKS